MKYVSIKAALIVSLGYVCTPLIPVLKTVQHEEEGAVDALCRL